MNVSTANKLNTEKGTQAARLKHISLSFICIPALFSVTCAWFLVEKDINIFNIIPDTILNSFTKEASRIEILQLVFYIWFKFMMTSQAILIGLLGIEAAQYQLEGRYGDIGKHVAFYKKYNGKSLAANNWISKKFYKLFAHKVVWLTWLSIFIIYIMIIFIFTNPLFSFL